MREAPQPVVAEVAEEVPEEVPEVAAQEELGPAGGCTWCRRRRRQRMFGAAASVAGGRRRPSDGAAAPEAVLSAEGADAEDDGDQAESFEPAPEPYVAEMELARPLPSPPTSPCRPPSRNPRRQR